MIPEAHCLQHAHVHCNSVGSCAVQNGSCHDSHHDIIFCHCSPLTIHLVAVMLGGAACCMAPNLPACQLGLQAMLALLAASFNKLIHASAMNASNMRATGSVCCTTPPVGPCRPLSPGHPPIRVAPIQSDHVTKLFRGIPLLDQCMPLRGVCISHVMGAFVDW